MTARVLVVDDIAANLRLLEARLLAEYYDVAVASGGAEALALAADEQPDIILLDVMMPGMDGYEVCGRLKADPRTAHIPVVMITALMDRAERVRGLEAGADDFLSKPVDDRTLFSRLRALLRTKQVLDAWRQRAETAHDLGLDALPDPGPAVAGARALLVCEDPDEGGLMAEALRLDGIEVEAVAEPAAAWHRLDEEAWDLAVVSLSLPGEEALRLASRLRAHGATRDLPVLLVADAGLRNQLLRGFDLGANDHALRPVDPNELRARARNQIRRKRYQERLRADLDRSLELAVTDALTGLRNRRYLQRHLDGLLRGGPGGGQGAAVLSLDVDRFKTLNDTHGHAAGDEALRRIAACIREHLRAVDVVARYGGEEFVVVMAGTPLASALVAAERLRAAIGRIAVPVGAGPGGEASVSVSVSIGVALARPGSDADAAVEAADAALYEAKRGGRDRVVAAPDPGLPEQARSAAS